MSGKVNLGFKPYTLGAAVSYLRVTSLQEAIAKCSDEDVRERAYALLEEHRVKKPGAFGLVDLTKQAEYRKGRK